jgi:Putative peptidoglycan binding domain
MALTSARFTSSRQLVAASENKTPLRKGARGRPVHLIQFALLDLGYAMPRSTGGSFSPDGIFGDETVNTVKAFQRSKGLKDDGTVGRDTMRALDAAFPQASHRVRVHFRSISLTKVPFEQALRNAATVYGQYGIDFQFASGESLLLSAEETALFDRIDQECNWEITAGEYEQLHNRGAPCPNTDVKVYFVNRMRDVLGCGGHAPDRPAATVAKEAWRWDMAHEVGHVLLTSRFSPVHHPHVLTRIPRMKRRFVVRSRHRTRRPWRTRRVHRLTVP